MIVQERFTLNGVEMIRTYSDSGRYVVGGIPESEYPEACDLASLGRTYVEGELIPSDEIAAQVEEVLNILLGVSE